MDTTLARSKRSTVFSPSLTEEQARKIYRQGEEAVVLALMTMAIVWVKKNYVNANATADEKPDERQLLANLITNGIEALAGVGGAAIAVRTRWVLTAPVAQVEITISDNGPGFREDILGRAFEPYVTSKARGTGLGLAIVQRIVEEHGGRISAENVVAGGARVRVLLPATADRRTESRRERA